MTDDNLSAGTTDNFVNITAQYTNGTSAYSAQSQKTYFYRFHNVLLYLRTQSYPARLIGA